MLVFSSTIHTQNIERDLTGPLTVLFLTMLDEKLLKSCISSSTISNFLPSEKAVGITAPSLTTLVCVRARVTIIDWYPWS